MSAIVILVSVNAHQGIQSCQKERDVWYHSAIPVKKSYSKKCTVWQRFVNVCGSAYLLKTICV